MKIPRSDIFEAIIVEDGKYFRYRPDDIGREWHELSIEAIVDLGKNLQRYEDDYRRAHPPTL